jgi:ABC-2 type transport system permease protein
MILKFLFATGIQNVLIPEKSKTFVQNTEVRDIMNSKTPDAMPELKINNTEPQIVEEIFSSLKDVDFIFIIGAFVFYFIGGYLLYASLFAIIGSAVDNEADTQQFMLPVTLPLILAIFVLINTMNNPEGDLAFWFSLIPFTSPIVMMARIPFHPASWEILLSAVLLVITFIGTTWMAGKIYRTGILMYGKKTSYKELGKWLRYRN